MWKLATLVLMLCQAPPAMAIKTLSIDQLEKLLVTLYGKSDRKVAGELDDVQLTERASPARLARWEAEFPGGHSRVELMKLADMSAFLGPPASDVVPNPRPDVKSQLHLLSMAVHYVANTMPRLPDFYATRETTHFQNNLSRLNFPAGGVSIALQPSGMQSQTVTYRDGHEVPFENTSKRQKEPAVGLTTNGEFGPILVQVLRDALASRISWLRSEARASGSAAVFTFTVPESASHFTVATTVGNREHTIAPAFHGEIEIDPVTGAILRLSEIADMTSEQTNQGAPTEAEIEVEYAPVTIAGRTYICPVKGVALSKIPMIRVSAPSASLSLNGVPTHGADGQSSGSIEIRLNDVAFTHYHEFRSETHIVTNLSGSSDRNIAGGSGPPTRETSDSASVPASSSPDAAVPTGSPESTSEEAVNSPSNASPAPNTGAPAPSPTAGSSDAPVTPVSGTAAKPEAEAAAVAAPPSGESISSNLPATGTVLHVQSKLVLVDVVVTDHDKPVTGLNRDRFHVFEDGREREITSFDENQPPPSVKITQPPALPPNTYSNVPTYPESSAINVLLLDALNTPMGDQEQVRRQMIRYLDTIKPGATMAVFTLSSRLRMAAGFTTDVGKLRFALDKRKSLPRSTADVGAGDGESISSTLTELSSGVGRSNLLGAALDSQIADFAADMKTYEIDQRVSMTLDAFRQLARYLAAVPGRKNLIWFTGSFPIDLGSNAGLSIPLKNLRDYSNALRSTSDLLSAARVAVYPVDARGVLMAPGSDASNTQAPIGNTSFAVQTSLEHGSMNTIAMETGGHVYSTANDLNAAVEKITANGSHYYTLSYVPLGPDASKNAPDFHTIEVKVGGAKYQLAYRHGYYTVHTDNLVAENGGMTKPMTEAATLGAPPSTQILFQARLLPDNTPDLNSASLDDNVVGEKSSSFRGGAHRYVVDLSVQLQDLAFAKGASGAWHAQLQGVLVAYDGEGQVVNSLGRVFHINLPPEQYQKLVAGGTVPARLALDLPGRGVVLRIVVYDPASAKTGSLEIPVQIASKHP